MGCEAECGSERIQRQYAECAEQAQRTLRFLVEKREREGHEVREVKRNWMTTQTNPMRMTEGGLSSQAMRTW